jgi:hypothetical protein
MEEYKTNFVAVIVAAVAMWILGAVWYTMFGTQWMAYTGVTEEMAKNMTGAQMAMAYGGPLVAYLLAFYVQDHMMFAFKSKNVMDGLQGGFWTWLGFVATVIYVTNSFQGKEFGLWLIDAGYWLIGLTVGSIILVLMKKKTPSASPMN